MPHRAMSSVYAGLHAPPLEVPCRIGGPFSSPSIKHVKHHQPPWNAFAVNCNFDLFCTIVKFQTTRELKHCNKIEGFGDII